MGESTSCEIHRTESDQGLSVSQRVVKMGGRRKGGRKKGDLPDNLRINKGTVEARVQIKGQVISRYFGAACPQKSHTSCENAKCSIKAAEEWVLKQKQHILRNNLSEFVPGAEVRMLWEDACQTWYTLHWAVNPSRTAKRKAEVKGFAEYMKRWFKGKYLDEITYVTVVQFRAKFKVISTANRYTAEIMSVFDRMEEWNELGNILTNKVKLPRSNPARLAEKYLRPHGGTSEIESQRDRMPAMDEIVEVIKWCAANDWELWEGMEKAIITAQRKQDLIAADARNDQGSFQGIAGKTKKRFRIPVSFPRPTSFINWRKRFDRLRVAFGWRKKEIDGQPNPKHTTWHDMRHVGPSMLAMMGYPTRIIKEFTGHTTDRQAERYITVPGDIIAPAVEDLRKKIEDLKAQAKPPIGGSVVGQTASGGVASRALEVVG